MTTYQLVRCDAQNGWTTETFTAENVIPAMSVRGFELDEGRVGGPHLREELRGQPCFKGLLGPMWGGNEGGEAVVRYENSEAYDRLST